MRREERASLAPAMESDPRREALLQRLNQIETLASPPTSLDRILVLAGDPEANIGSLSEAIQVDPSITARVLKLANSAYFGFSRHVETVDEAIMVIGSRNVRNLAACAVVGPLFDGESAGIELSALWRHCCGVAEAARLIAIRQSTEDGPAYIAGLLHDIGQVILAETLREAYAVVLQKDRRIGGLDAVEREALGGDHAWAGGVLCERWHLSPGVIAAIRCHHQPERDESGSAARVCLAEWLAANEGLGDPSDPGLGESDAPESAILAQLRLAPADAEELAAQLGERREAIDMLYHESLGRGR